MSYRIHFEPKGAYWCVQMQVYWFFWRTVEHEVLVKTNSGSPLVMEPVKFDTYEGAAEYVRGIGLNMAYREAVSMFSTVPAGQGYQPEPYPAIMRTPPARR